MTESGTVVDNPYSWNLHSNLLYLDQPVGSGYSYTENNNSYPTTEYEVAEGMYTALQLFFQSYPIYSKLNFYIVGESYAGKYVPSLATYINEQNKLENTNLVINLQGIALGNGWVDPVPQNQAYVDYPYGLGLIDSYQRDQAQQIQNQLAEAVANEQWIDANNLSNDLEAVVLTAAGNVDIDNVLYPVDPLGNLIGVLVSYLNRPDVKKSLNVGNHTFSFENLDTANALNADEQQSVLHLLPNLIASYRVLIYTGNVDMNCNLLGVEAYLNKMNWTSNAAFYKAPNGLWIVNGTLAGYARSIGNLEGASLTNLVVRNAGHEVPYFQPVNALDLFNRFITGAAWTNLTVPPFVKPHNIM